jgi:hypothetical protein
VRLCTTALVNCVVPIITAPICPVCTPACCSRRCSAAVTPVVMSAELFIFTQSTTRVPSMTTASVLVPPTSIPILSTLHSFSEPATAVDSG